MDGTIKNNVLTMYLRRHAWQEVSAILADNPDLHYSASNVTGRHSRMRTSSSEKGSGGRSPRTSRYEATRSRAAS